MPLHVVSFEVAHDELKTATMDEVGESFRWLGPREQEALELIAAQVHEYRCLLGSLDAFGDRLEAQVVCQADDGGNDGSVVAFGTERADERSIDLDDVDRELPQVGE